MDVQVGQLVLSSKPLMIQPYWRVVTRYYSFPHRLAEDYSWGCIICNKVYPAVALLLVGTAESRIRLPAVATKLAPYLIPSEINSIKNAPFGIVKWVDGQGHIESVSETA